MKPDRGKRDRNSRCGGLLLVITAATLMVGTPIREAEAQSPPPEQIAQMLDQARKLHEELLPIAQRLGDAALLTRLQSLRAQWVQARGHMQGRRYTQAGTLAKRVYDQLRQLSSQIHLLAQRLPYYNRMAERNRELLQVLQGSVGPNAPAEIRRQLTLASDAIQRAQKAHQNRSILQAYRLMEQAENQLRQVLRYVDRSGLTPESVRREIEETNRRMERLEGSSNLVEAAIEALERARMIQVEAERLLAAGELRQALANTLSARTALRLAARLITGALTPEDVAAAIAHAEELMEVHSELLNSPLSAVRSLMQQARRQLNQARSHLEAGRLNQGLKAAQTSAKLILTAARTAGGPPPPSTQGR